VVVYTYIHTNGVQINVVPQSVTAPNSPLQHQTVRYSTEQSVTAPNSPLQHPTVRYSTEQSVTAPNSPLQHQTVRYSTEQSVTAPNSPLQHQTVRYSTKHRLIILLFVANVLLTVNCNSLSVNYHIFSLSERHLKRSTQCT
jgi:hypothetical protein